MRTRLTVRSIRRIILAALTGLAGSTLFSDGCLDSSMAKRFREASGNGFTAGLSSVLQTPDQPTDGLTQIANALADGLAAIIQPRTPSSSGSSGSTTSGSGH